LRSQVSRFLTRHAVHHFHAQLVTKVIVFVLDEFLVFEPEEVIQHLHHVALVEVFGLIALVDEREGLFFV